MSFDLREIARSWLIAANPSPLQEELAQKRYNICLQCEHYRETRLITHDEHCNDCGCPLQKKIFSPKFDACQQHKWLDIDTQYKKAYFDKNSKSSETLL
jgi:hypothetical protein